MTETVNIGPGQRPGRAGAVPVAGSLHFSPDVSRAFKFTLLIGAQVSLLLAVVQWPGLLRPLDAALAGKLGLAGAAALPNTAAQYAAVAALAFGVAWTTIDINRPLFKALVAALALAEVCTLAVLAALGGAYFSPVLPGAAVVMAFIAGFVYSRSDTGRRQRVADAAYGGRLSDRQRRILVDGSAPVLPAGQVQELTLVVAEIFNHQALMDALPPAEYAAVCNRYLHAAAEALVERGGTLMACDGEGARALFGTPLPDPEHATQACRAALEVARQVRALNADLARHHEGLACDLRLGVNSGDMAVGQFGSRRLEGFGAAGEEVAFARRLCVANLIYGTAVLIGARTLELAEAAIEARPLELLRRRLGDSWQEVYELLGETHALTADDLARRDLFWTGVIFYRERRLGDALDKFSQARPPDGRRDGPLDFYVNRIRQLQIGREATPEFETARLLDAL